MIALSPALYAVVAILAPAQTAPEPSLMLTVTAAADRIDELTGESVLDLQLDPSSTQAFAEFTADNVGKGIVVSADGETLTSPIIQGPITAGQLTIAGGSPEQWHIIAARLNSESTKIMVRLQPADQP